MIKIGLDEIKKIEVDILLSIDDFCKKNGIRYSLAYGTLIGCIRHKGFIPWDDDIDIWMPRPDFLRFVNEFHHDFYKVKSAEIDNDYLLYFAKVFDTRTTVIEESGYKWSVFVDIIPIDGIGNDIKKAESHYKSVITERNKYYRYRNLMEISTVKPNTLKGYLKKILMKFINVIYPCKKCRDKFLKRVQLFDYDNSSLVYDCALGNNIKLLPKTMVENLTSGEFEGRSFNIPVEYDKWLRLHYGDYMQLPPEEERYQHHRFQAFWNEA